MGLIKNQNTVYHDVDLTFNVNPRTRDIGNVYDSDAVKRSIRNILSLNTFDIPFDNTNIKNIKRMLFEPVNYITSSVLSTTIKFMIEKYDNRVNIISIDVIPNESENGYNVTLIFSIKYVETQSSLKIFLQRVR